MTQTSASELAAYRMLGDAVSHADDARAVVTRLASTLQHPVALTDLRGNVLAMSPAGTDWPLDALRMWRPGADQPAELEEIRVDPVSVDGEVVALLCTRSAAVPSPAVQFARGLIANDVARRQARVSGRRELVGQVLDDIFRGVLNEREATRRLQGIGIAPERPYRVIIGDAGPGSGRPRSFPWNLHALLSGLDEPVVRAVVGGRMVMVVADGGGAPALATTLLEHLASSGTGARVGIGGAFSGVAGLRLSSLEAQDALAIGPGVHEASSLDLGRLLLVADLGLPLRELAERLLEPLRRHDAQHGAQLVETLRVWFEADCVTSETATRLFVHRNTIRYRLALVTTLTGQDLASFSTRMHLWFAVRSLDLDALGA